MTAISKILIVDDKPENLVALQKTFENMGIKFICATSGQEALKAILHHEFALIILDVMMPVMDGYELAELIRGQKETKNIPLIFLTAMDSTEKSLFKGYQAGAVDYLFKPVDENILQNKLNIFVELDQQKKELERSNRDLKVFASAASHDLKTPLRHINNLANFLIEDYSEILDKEGTDHIKEMKLMANRMSHMIEGILQFAQITKEVKPLESIDLKKIISIVMETLQTQIKETNGTINVQNLPILNGERQLLLQLFQNLISNALKFHRIGEPPVINIYGQSKGNYWEINIEDNGIGFDEKEATQIFQPLKRLVSKDDYEGSGFGLATCKKIVDHHNGTISFRSQPGKGTTFIINLPND